MAIRSISLVITDTTQVVVRGVPARQTTLLLTNAVAVSSKLFVVQRVPLDVGYEVEYRTIATPADLSNLAEDSPPPNDRLQPFRVNTVTITTDDPKQVDEFITTIRRRLTELLYNLKALEITITTSYDIEV